MLIAQLTDLHVVEPGGLVADRVDTAAALRRALATLDAIDPRPDVALLTGDLVNDGLLAQYAHLRELMLGTTVRVAPVPGNHDDRTQLRRWFEGVVPGGAPDEPINYTVDDAGPVRLVGLDTTVPGQHGGVFAEAHAAWLDATLSQQPDRPTIVFQHHPPFDSGIAFMDRMGLVGSDLEATVVARHPNVVAVVAGHLHRSIHTAFAGTVASCWPSTGPQLVLELRGEGVAYTNEPAAIALHRWDGARLTSHLVPVGEHERWVPSWAGSGT